MTPLPDKAFINDEATNCIKKETIGAIIEAVVSAIIALRNSPFFILCFTVSVAPSTNKPDFSSDSTIFIISFKPSFEMNKGNPFAAVTALLVAIAPCTIVFLIDLSNTYKIALVANLGKTSLAKKTARSNNAFLSKLLITLPNVLSRNPRD